jgi:hypothetical protein
MTRDDNDSDGLDDAHPALWEAKLSRADEHRIKAKCFIPRFVKIRFDEEKKGAIVRSDYHEVCVYEAMFRVGFRLPFLSMVRELLNYLNLAPHQLVPNAWRYLHTCTVLWPLALGKERQLTVREFLHLYWVHKNPGGSKVYNIQTRWGKLITLETKYSSNRGWKNKFFFASGQWEFAPSEKAIEIRVPREVNALSEKGGQEPHLTQSELARVNEVQQWAQKHESCLLYGVLGSILRLIEFVYEPVGHVAVVVRNELFGILANMGPPTANTRGVTPRKDQAQAANKGKSKKIDKGKGKMTEPKKPKNAVYPIQTGGAFTHEWKALTPLASPMVPPKKKSPTMEKKKVEVPHRVARALKRPDKEDELEVERPVKAVPKLTP